MEQDKVTNFFLALFFVKKIGILDVIHMAKRSTGLKPQKSHSHKTKKRLAAKRVMLEAKKK